jgi:ribonuclease BN (tRNA processing enzyme)
VRVRVLGKSPAWQDVDGACSGYLIEEGDFRLLLECGNGVFGKLRKQIDYTDLNACVISHCHADHTLDLVPYSYALAFAPRQQPVPVPPWPGTANPARPDLVERAFAATEYGPDAVLECGPFRIRFRAVPHFLPAYAIEVTSTATGRRLVYGSDCAPNDELVEFATGADLLLIEATLPRPERTGPRGHLTAAEAGDHARRAEVGRAVLTHISDEEDRDVALAAAAATAGAVPVEIAATDAVYDL